ncbi:MAG: DegT/DnrJ/EryC1/StrS family aminotransferase [Kineosporiaceae bacterium]|nr:DegT/DnrJ/EryC1/StrS family aminotransferase [Aeromicrobium sp.]
MIPVSQPSVGELERAYLLDAFDSGWISSHGEYLGKAEGLLRSIGEVQHAAVANNGTTALHLALLALGIGAGDEVVIPSLSYVATLNAVLYVGAIPVIVDVDPATWCIDPVAAEQAVSSRTRAILAVDLYGCPADYEALGHIAHGHNLFVIADAAESLGAAVGDRQVGGLADVTTLSFFGNKIATSGEGGAVLTDHDWVDERVRRLRNQGNHPTRRYHHDILGYNYRMTNLAAAVLSAQLERLPELVANRVRVFEAYRQLLNGHGVTTQAPGPHVRMTPWLYTVTCDGYEADQRDALMAKLLERGFDSRPVFQPLETMPYFSPGLQHSRAGRVASRVSSSGISLPTFPDLRVEDIQRIADAVATAMREIETQN